MHEAREWYANQKVMFATRGGKPKCIPLFDAWMQWPMRNDFLRLEYAPGKQRELKGAWNTWPGWGAEAIEGDTTPWEELLEHIFGTGGEGLWARRYFEQWCAYPIQNPGARMNVATVFTSHAQGSGKSLVFQILGSVYGDANYSEIGTEELKGTFNQFLVNKQFILGDELTNRENLRVGTELLKRMVTRRRIEVNLKYMRQYAAVNRVNWGLTSNYRDAIYINDADRRFFVWEVVGGELPTKLRDRLVAWWESGQAAGPLRFRLEHSNPEGFHSSAPAPRTAAKADAEAANKTALEQSIDAMLATDAGEGTANPSWPFGRRDLWSLEDIQGCLKLGEHSTRTYWKLPCESRRGFAGSHQSQRGATHTVRHPQHRPLEGFDARGTTGGAATGRNILKMKHFTYLLTSHLPGHLPGKRLINSTLFIFR